MRPAPWLLAALLLAPLSTSAQSYQRYADGFLSVHARRLGTGQHQADFRVCAELMREARPGLVEVRLIFRGSGDSVLGQEVAVLRAEFGRPTCQTVSLPPGAARMSRWEIARFRLQRQPPPAADPHYPASARLMLP